MATKKRKYDGIGLPATNALNIAQNIGAMKLQPAPPRQLIDMQTAADQTVSALGGGQDALRMVNQAQMDTRIRESGERFAAEKAKSGYSPSLPTSQKLALQFPAEKAKAEQKRAAGIPLTERESYLMGEFRTQDREFGVTRDVLDAKGIKTGTEDITMDRKGYLANLNKTFADEDAKSKAILAAKAAQKSKDDLARELASGKNASTERSAVTRALGGNVAVLGKLADSAELTVNYLQEQWIKADIKDRPDIFQQLMEAKKNLAAIVANLGKAAELVGGKGQPAGRGVLNPTMIDPFSGREFEAPPGSAQPSAERGPIVGQKKDPATGQVIQVVYADGTIEDV